MTAMVSLPWSPILAAGGQLGGGGEFGMARGLVGRGHETRQQAS